MAVKSSSRGILAEHNAEHREEIIFVGIEPAQ